MRIHKVRTSSGEIKWEVSGRANGRGTKSIRRRFDRRVDAEAFLSDFKSRSHQIKGSSGLQRNFEETTFAEEANFWLEFQASKFSPGHHKRVRAIVAELVPMYGRFNPNYFTALRLEQIQVQLLDKGAKAATVNRKTEVINAVLNFSAKHKRIPFNPTSGFSKLKEVREEMKFWDENEAFSFLEFAETKYPEGSERRWVYVSYMLALNTGMRAGEIWGLQLKDLVENGEILFVRRQFDRVKKDFRPPKGKKPRRVPCNPDLRTELTRLAGERNLHLEATFFRGEEGRPINHDSFADLFDRDVRAWGGKRIRFHDLRHTATTLMIRHGVDLKTVKEICGHQNVSTTMNYAHLVADSVNMVAKSFVIGAKSPSNVVKFPRSS